MTKSYMNVMTLPPLLVVVSSKADEAANATAKT